VLDRDYMKIPVDQIKDIKPLLTMVNGKVVYEAAGQKP
jgi:predicted amidohydrolase YtcJ